MISVIFLRSYFSPFSLFTFQTGLFLLFTVTDWALGGAALGLTVALVEFIANSVVEVKYIDDVDNDNKANEGDDRDDDDDEVEVE